MEMTMASTPQRREGVEAQPLPDGSGLLFDPETATAYPITPSAMRIWEMCDGAHAVPAIVDELEASYEMDRATLERDALLLLADFAEKRLVLDPSAAA